MACSIPPDAAKERQVESDRQHQRRIASLNLPESGFGTAFHEHRHIVADWIAVEQPVGLYDHLLDLRSPKSRKPISQSIDELGDTLILLQLIHSTILRPTGAGRQLEMFRSWPLLVHFSVQRCTRLWHSRASCAENPWSH